MSIENIFHIWRQRNFTLHFPFVDLKFAKLYIYGCFLVTKLCPTLLQPHGQEPNRLPSPWDFPGKNTGVGCHFLFQGITQPRGRTQVSCITGRFYTTWATGKLSRERVFPKNLSKLVFFFFFNDFFRILQFCGRDVLAKCLNSLFILLFPFLFSDVSSHCRSLERGTLEYMYLRKV